jgi:hypothetical protein
MEEPEGQGGHTHQQDVIEHHRTLMKHHEEMMEHHRLVQDLYSDVEPIKAQ